MYIINYRDGGFAIVSATKNCYPVLAYSDEGSFTLSKDMGGALCGWITQKRQS